MAEVPSSPEVFGQPEGTRSSHLVRGGMTDSTHPHLLTRGSPPAGYPGNDVGGCPRPHLAPTLTHEAQMIPFLTAVNITDGTADFDAEGAAFVNGLTSRTFRGRACVSKQEQNHIQYKAPSAHFWAEGQIDAPLNIVFKLRMKVTGSGNGWYVVQGVEYPG